MSNDSMLTNAIVYMAAAVVAVPIASRLKLGSVLGYLGAGSSLAGGVSLDADAAERVVSTLGALSACRPRTRPGASLASQTRRWRARYGS